MAWWTRQMRGLLRSDSGNVAIVFSVLLVPVVALIGAALDYSRASSAKAAMQAALDATALNLARESGSLGAAALKEKALALFQSNFNRPDADNVQVMPDRVPDQPVLVLYATAEFKTALIGLIGISKMEIAATSKVTWNSETAGACVISLDPATKHSFKISGTGTVHVPNCGVYVNSSHKDALDGQGSGWLKAKSIRVVGGTRGGMFDPTPQINQPKVSDPLAGVPEPVMPATCTYSNRKFEVPETLPGGSVYCGSIAFNASVVLGPGIHFFRNAKVTLASNVDITGKDVMLYFGDGSSLDKGAGSGAFSIEAMKSGDYQGIAIFGTRNTKTVETFKLTGNKDYYVKGSVYLPGARLEMYGTADLTVDVKSGWVIAWQFFYQGSSSFTMDSFGGAAPVALSTNQTLVRLLE